MSKPAPRSIVSAHLTWLSPVEILTNANGKGTAGRVFTPDDIAPFGPPLSPYARWVLEREGMVEYQTNCTVINLD